MAALHHLALRTADVERLVTFYRTWFAFEVARDLSPRSVWLSVEPGAVLMIERAEADEPAIPLGTRELHAFAIDTAQRAELRTRLVAERLLEAETEHTLYFRDPDGRRVAVSSYPLAKTGR
jgi:catechol 2,3-dioxygenase-like lactoylglutathione lyase family enzyme